LDVAYEDLIDQPEQLARKMIRHCNLDWEPACMDFTRNRRPVYTASHFQVRQPLYSTSIEKWRKYKPYLNADRSILQENKNHAYCRIKGFDDLLEMYR